MFLALSGPGGTLPKAESELVTDLQLCKALPGWTLDYVRGLDAIDKEQVLTVLDAMNRAETFRLKQQSKHSGKKGR